LGEKIAEAFGARKMIYVKDEDGLYEADPKKDPSAKHITSAFRNYSNVI
jgi:uridylate kinase